MFRIIVLLSMSIGCAAGALAQDAAGPASGNAAAIAREPIPLAAPADEDTLRAIGRFVAESDVPRRVTWQGRVEDSGHRSLAGARVWLIPNGRSARAMGLPTNGQVRWGGAIGTHAPDWFADVPLERLPSAVTDAGGRFAITAPFLPFLDDEAALMQGLYRPVIVVSAAGCAMRTDSLDDPLADVVTLRDTILEPEAAVTGLVVDENDRPMSGVRVRAHQERATPAFDTRRSWYSPALAVGESCETWTDAQGRFTVAGLWTGDVSLELHFPEFVRLESELVPTHHDETADAGRLVMHAGATIGGVVRDVEGRALQGVEVIAVNSPVTRFGLGCGVADFASGDDTLPMELLGCFSAASVHTTSASDGSFRLAGLRGDKPWTLYALAEDHEPAVVRGVEAGRRAVVFDLALEARWLVRLRDAVTGQPLQGARLDARRIGKFATWMDERDPPVFFATPVAPRAAAEAGRWIVPGVGTLATQLIVWAPGHAAAKLRLPGLRPGESAEQEVALAPVSPIAGRVADVDGEPLAAAEVCVVASDDHSRVFTRRSTDAEGAFEFPTLSVGRWDVVASAEGFAQQVLPAAIGQAGRGRELDFRLAPGAVIEGEVIAESGAPAWHAEVHLQERTAEGFRDLQSTPFLSWYGGTEEDGHYTYRHVPAGEYRVLMPGAEPVRVKAAGGERHCIPFLPAEPRVLRGRVDSGGVGVADACVEVRFSPVGPGQVLDAVFTDEHGDFEHEFPGPGSAELTVKGGHVDAGLIELTTVSVDVTDRNPAPLHIALSTGRIEGRLSDPTSGAPWPASKVILLRDDDELGSTTTDGAGHFAFAYLPPGSYVVSCLEMHEGRHLPAWTEPLALADGASLMDVRLLSSEGAVIRGVVHAPAGADALEGVHLRLRRVVPDEYVDDLEIAEGRFRYAGLPDGAYRIGLVRTPNWWNDKCAVVGEVPVELRAGTPADVELTQPPER